MELPKELQNIRKYQLSQDVYSDALSARVRANDLGFDGAIHVTDVDGQAYYMPGPTHDAYLERMAQDIPPQADEPEYSEKDLVETFLEVMRLILEKGDMAKSEEEIKFDLLKVDEEQRIIYGWASVTTYKGDLVVDRQDEVIRTETLHKAVNEFMKGVRVGKVLHVGDQTGTIVHSFPISKEICDALEIQSDKEGWITGYYVEDDDLWKAVKSGDFSEFSIGGNADMREFNAN